MKLLQTKFKEESNPKQVDKLLGSESMDVMNIQLKAGEEIPTHHADCNVLVVVRKGTISFTVEEETVELTNGVVLSMEPYENHSLQAVEDADLIVVKAKVGK
ncbi:hypothetical protein SporoP37_12250 [Sporosarcina sp. P37]|uniref:cupin domain-containing protein n=1 Tax=unclassified Sporosarcina TaxID=2647733 RepID=UPI000A17B7B3|nr:MULTISPECIES: cupin domain-containing protein [unclassified Sporosarcina]ARK25350.1 hypothetical protein SporoP37_12250 [Sporosarcina sp. P37]PID17148.1 hypothetical protein CSV62_15090 [Sporosarcina sp. P35]